MPRHLVAASAQFTAPAGYVYALLADYTEGHRRILPPRYFRQYEVERGGVGTGTVIRFVMPAFGRARHVRATVAEPEPGRVLLETDTHSGARTTFTVDPTPTGGSTVTITTELTVSPGVRGRLEGWLATRFLRRVYRDELARLGTALSRPARDDGWTLPLGGVRLASVRRSFAADSHAPFPHYAPRRSLG